MGNALVEAGSMAPTDQEEKLLETLAVDIDESLVHSRDESEGKRRHVGMDDFQVIQTVGKGSFATVRLVRHNASGKLFALKTLKKIVLVKRDKVLHTKTERWVLQHVDHPFLVRLRFAWQTPSKLYMVLDFMDGGELFYWLKKHRKFSEGRARLVAAEVALGLEALHDRGILYRDLKPENILLDAEGHIRIADFGLSKEGVKAAGRDGGATTFCGTPEYIAPEILMDHGHGFAVDWWSLGTLLYEMLAGLPPFYDSNLDFMYRKVLRAPLRFTHDFTDEAQGTLRGLLERDPEARLGSQGGADEILAQPFFSSLERDSVLNKEYQPEFRPPHGRLHIDPDFLDSPDEIAESLKDGPMFEGFTYDETFINADDSDDET